MAPLSQNRTDPVEIAIDRLKNCPSVLKVKGSIL